MRLQRGHCHFESSKMQISNLILGVLLASTADITMAIKFYEVDVDNGTEDELSLLTTTPLFETVGGTSDQILTGNIIDNIELQDDDQNNNTTPSFPTLELPENHKNETSSPYVSSIELPPVLNQFNTYQQQYKKYYQQKNEYDYKPIKFESNSAKNHYLVRGLGSYLDNNDASHRYEELKYREPFPYTYENERIPFISQPVWSSQVEANEVGHNYAQPSKVEGHFPKDADQSLNGWKKAVKFLTTLLPLGLLLATLTPSVLSVNSTTDQKLAKQRSLDEGLDDFKEYFNRVNNMNNPECERKLICELSRLGKDMSGTYFQKSFWFLANETPDDTAQQLGVGELFRRVREGKCELYKCQKKRKKPSAKKSLPQELKS